MSDRIKELEEQANVILEWCRQQSLPEEDRDFCEAQSISRDNAEWHIWATAPVFLDTYRFRLRKRPKIYKVTVYWYRNGDGIVRPSLAKREHQWPGSVLLGTTTDEFTEPQE